MFCCGTTGEGVLLTQAERMRVAELYRAVVHGTLIVHAGAQTTAATCELAAHARAAGADGVAVIPPPYYPLSDAALAEHFVASAAACAPLPFYLYAFSARSGYPITPAVAEQVRERAPNLAGMKVSEGAIDAVAAFIELGLPVFVGSERLLPQALALGAAGSVSGLASVHPAAVAALLREPNEANLERVKTLRAELDRGTLIANAKRELARQGVPIRPDVRRPLLPA